MDITLTGNAAFRIARRARTEEGLALAPTPDHAVPLFDARKLDLGRRATLCDLTGCKVLPVRARDRGRRPTSADFVGHYLRGPFPEATLYELRRLDEGTAKESGAYWDAGRLLLDGPPLMLIGSAGKFTRAINEGVVSYDEAIIRLAFIAMELTGGYAYRMEGARRGGVVMGINPACSCEGLKCGIKAFKGLSGIRLARNVAGLMMGESKSPMESLLSIILGFPVQYGGLGYGLRLNEPIASSLLRDSAASHRQLTPDVTLANVNICLEFDSRSFHDTVFPAEKDSPDYTHSTLGRTAFREDRVRVQDYQALGISLFPVTAEDIAHPQAVQALTLKVAAQVDRMAANGAETQRVKTLFANPAWRGKLERIIKIGFA